MVFGFGLFKSSSVVLYLCYFLIYRLFNRLYIQVNYVVFHLEFCSYRYNN